MAYRVFIGQWRTLLSVNLIVGFLFYKKAYMTKE